MTLRLRLLLVLAGLVAVGLVVSDVATTLSLRSTLYSQIDTELVNAQSAIGSLTTQTLPCTEFGDGRQAGQVTFAGQVWVDVLQSDGEAEPCLSEQNSVLPAPVLPSSLPGQLTGSDAGYNAAGASETSEFFFASSVAGQSSSTVSYRVLVTALYSRGGTDIGTIIVAAPLTAVHRTLRDLILGEILVSVFVLAGLGLIGWWVVRRGLRPLEEMATTARDIAAGDLSRRVAESGLGGEVGQLGVALNTMLGRIEDAFDARRASEDRLRRFLADASHELRTPLTSIRGYTEMFDRGARDRPEDLATAMRHIQTEAIRMGVLVEDLLLLARLDQERPLAWEVVDVGQVLEISLRTAQLSDPDREITSSGGTEQVYGDSERLQRLVDNIVTNALKYTPPGTPITLSLRRIISGPQGDELAEAGWSPIQSSPSYDPNGKSVESWVEIWVADRGPGIPEADRASIFEPFHRVDPSRARTTGGVGLGLAIVASIAHAHGGRVAVVDNPGGGSIFIVRLPKMGSADSEK